MEYPDIGELVIVKVKKILPFGAILSLEEYEGREAFVHISEVFSGWVRNIRDHVKEGQVTVGKVIAVDRTKHQVDLSFKRASEADKKRKTQLFQSGKRARKMLEVTAVKLKVPLPAAMQEAAAPLEAAYGDLWSAFESLSKDEPLKVVLSKAWEEALRETAKREIKPKRVQMRGLLTLKSYASDGLVKIKTVLAELQKQSFDDATFEMHYVSAPAYLITVDAETYKYAEKVLTQLGRVVEEKAKGADFESSLEIQKA
ncbi:S1 RNA-binding domain-containing protein [Candidatus Micrarchaeota archaeon]|nr:S1 RNA-binding domain-containing protein [Candidatus Micrarchaeota archaeon]